MLIPPGHHSQNTEHRPCFLFLVQHYSLPKNFCTSPTPTDPPRSAQSPDRCYFSPSSRYPQLCSPPSIPSPLGSLSSPTTPNLPLHSPRSCGGGFLSGLLSVGPHVVLVPMPHTLYHHFSPPPPPQKKKKNPQQDLVGQKPSGGLEKLKEFSEVKQLVGAENRVRVVGAHPPSAHSMPQAPSWCQSLRHLPTHQHPPFPMATWPVSSSSVIRLAKLILWK